MSKYEMCNDNRFEIIRELKKYIIEATNIDTSPKEMEVLDNFCFRLWQLGLTLETKNKLKSLEKENQELKNKNSALEFWNECYAKENEKLKKAIEIIMKWRRDQIYDLIQNLERQNINGFETLKEVLESE